MAGSECLMVHIVRSVLSLCWLAGLALSAPAAAGPSCSLDWVCVEPQDRDDGSVSFLVRNLQPYPLTLSLRASGRNLKAEGTNPVTGTVPPGSALVLLTLAPIDAARETWYRYRYDWTVGSVDATHDDDYVYRLPYARGDRFRVLQGYDSSFSHTGAERYTVDFAMPVGTPVHAAREGVVARVQERHDRGCWEDGCGRYANFIVVLHEDGTTGEYYHLQQNGALVEPGDRVVRGQHIGLSGNTGHTTMPHLHFAVYRAAAWGNTQSVPVRFMTEDGIIPRPRRGAG